MELYGREYMAELGRRGGRPRLPTLDELRQQSASKAENKVKEGVAALPNNLKVLKKLWKQRRGELELQSNSPRKGVGN